MRLRTLGDLKLDRHDFSRPKPLLLLSYLSLEGSQDRRHLAELFYPGSARPLGSLASELTRIRKALPGAVGTSEERAWSELSMDAQELLAALEGGDLKQALELYQGRFLDGLHLKDWGSELENWVYGTREYLAAQVRGAMIRLAEDHASRGDFEEAARQAERAYLLSGAPEPEVEELTRLYRLLLAGDNPQATEVRKEAQSYGITLEPTKELARRELAGPEDAARPSTTSLPVIRTSFVGRESELTELSGLLAQPDCPLLTLTGPGGTGKTRLALQLGHKLAAEGHFPDGVMFVALEALPSPEGMPAAIASGLGLEVPGASDPLVVLKRWLGEKRLLLILDNFEQLVGGATVVADLLGTCPNVTVLVTSRERLNLAEERVFPVEGLIDPSAGGEVSRETQYRDAIELFGQRAKQADHRFSLTPKVHPHAVRICELVACSPLALELAAAWVSVLPVAEIADEVGRDLDVLASTARNLPERHRSVRGAFEHSWRLLSPREQEAYRKLAVFRGGFRREAAAEVTRATIPLLASLVGKSLLQVLPSGRFEQHRLLRQFAEEKLGEHPAEEAEAREQHGRYFLTFVEAGEPKFRTEEEKAWLEQLDEEYENVRAALGWMQENEEIEFGLRLGSAMRWYWRVRGHGREGSEWLWAALAHPAASERTAARAKALLVVSNLPGSGGFASQAPWSEESVDIWRELGDDRGLAQALLVHGNILFRLGDVTAGISLLEEAAERARKVGDTQNLPQILGHLGAIHREAGERERARQIADEIITSFAT